MNGLVATLVLGLAAAVAAAGDLPAPAKNPLAGDLPFLEDLAAARTEARWRGKPLLVFYCLAGEKISLRVADGAFRDAAVVGKAAAFVPVLLDADAHEAFGIEYGVKTVPTILLLDQNGQEAGRSSGGAGPAEVAAALDGALRKMGGVRPTKEGKALADAAGYLAVALEKGDWKTVLKAAVAVEKIGHAGPELEAARAARKDAETEAAKRLDAAKKLFKDGKRDEARGAFRTIAREFAGLDAAVEAKNLVKEMDGPDPEDHGGGGDTGGGGKGKNGKDGKGKYGKDGEGGHSPPRRGG